MARTLLIPTPEVAVHEWVEVERGKTPLILLDPADATRVPAGRTHRIAHEFPEESVFFGSLSPERAPHLLLAALARLLVPGDCLVQTFPYRETPLLRQTVHLIAEVMQPDRIVLAAGLSLAADRWPVGPEEVTFPPALPETVRRAQRKAQWLRMIERGQAHEVPFRGLTIQGTRWGSGRPLGPDAWAAAGLPEVLHAEVCGSSLFLVTEDEFQERFVGRALDFAHAQRLVLAAPADFEELLCAFVREGGEEFGYGRIQQVDFTQKLVRAETDAVPPVPVQILKVGSLSIDNNGNEQGEIRPWQT